MSTRPPRRLTVALALVLAPAARPAEPRLDLYGDPLPEGAVARLGTLRFRAPDVIRNVRVSPDGKRIAARTDSGLVVFDAESGRVVRESRFAGTLGGPLAWLPDGRGVLVAIDNPDNPLVLEFTDPRSPAPAPGSSADGMTGAKIESGQVRVLPKRPGPFALSADGRLLASAAYDPTGRRWTVAVRGVSPGKRLRKLRLLRELGPAPDRCDGLRFTNDGTALGALCLSGEPGKLCFVLWDLGTGKERCRRAVPTPAEHAGRWSFALSPDGKWLAVGLADGSARLFDLAADKEPRSFARHAGKAEWQKGVSALAFSPDGKLLVTAGRDRVARGWEPETLRGAWTPKDTGEEVESVDFSPDGKRVMTGGRGHVIRKWDAGTLREIETAVGHRGPVLSAAASPDGRTAVTAGSDGSLLVWELATGRPLRRINASGEIRGRLALAPDGKTVVVTVDEAPRGWDVTTGEPVPLPGDLGKAAGVCQGFGPGGRTLVLADAASASVWDWPTGRRLRSFDFTGGTGQTEYTYCAGAALSPDGTLLATSCVCHRSGLTGYTHTDVWDTASGKRVTRLECSALEYASPFFLPGGKGLALATGLRGSPRGVEEAPPIGLWDPRTGKLRQAFRPVELVDVGPSSPFVRWVVLSPDGRTLATAEDGGSVLYEVATGQARRKIIGQLGMAFTPDGRRLVTARGDQTALVWDVSLAGAAARSKPPAGDGERGSLWAALSAGPAQPAYEAMARLAADPPATVAFLRERLPPARPGREALERLFEGLDDNRFAVRQRAAAELDRVGRGRSGRRGSGWRRRPRRKPGSA